MNVFTSLGILLISMLILAFLQLVPGTFLLFSHYTSAKFSRREASNLALFFIIGVETANALLFTITYFIVYAFLATISEPGTIIAWIFSGILIALAIIFTCFYYRKGSGTSLFIPRKIAHTLNDKAFSAKSFSDAFCLGFISTLPELIFTFPLFIISSVEIMQIGENASMRAFLIILFVITTIIPLFLIRFRMNLGRNLADIQKFRVHNKPFFRFFISILYLLIAILIIVFRISI